MRNDINKIYFLLFFAALTMSPQACISHFTYIISSGVFACHIPTISANIIFFNKHQNSHFQTVSNLVTSLLIRFQFKNFLLKKKSFASRMLLDMPEFTVTPLQLYPNFLAFFYKEMKSVTKQSLLQQVARTSSTINPLIRLDTFYYSAQLRKVGPNETRQEVLLLSMTCV